MKILSAEQTRQADAATIEREPIHSVDLMERAATAFTNEFLQHFRDKQRPVFIFCGPGNNGGDGLAIGRMLLGHEYDVHIFTVHAHDKGSDDFKVNRDRLEQQSYAIRNIEENSDIPVIPSQAILIDGLFGSGLTRKIEGIFADVIKAMNEASATVVAIDIPSGLYADKPVEKEAVLVKAHYTFTFQLPKLAFLLPQNELIVGEWKVLDIGLYQPFIDQADTPYFYVETNLIKPLHKKRHLFSNKGDYGKTLLIAGSYGKMGAAILAARACLKSGVGLLTVHVPECGYEIMQIANPEAMTTLDRHQFIFTSLEQEGRSELDKYDVVGVGPGIGTAEETVEALTQLLSDTKSRNMRMVMDADALNICGKHRKLLKQIPEHSILTPHPKEFERLTEKAKHDFHRLELLRNFSRDHKVFVTLKGSRTAISTPEGNLYFNCTGNPGMATGGTGDALTGMLTALIAQQYDSFAATLLGVYLHGLAGDLATEKLSQEGMVASDLIDHVGEAFKTLY